MKAVDVDGNSVTDYMYYNENWQIVEIRRGVNQTPTAAAYKQFVYDIRYVDAPVCRWWDADGDGTMEPAAGEMQYFTNDGNFNTTALVDANSGGVVERYLYDPYGRVTVLNGAAGAEKDPNVAEWSPDADNKSDWDNEVLFCGYWYDPETGLYHVRERYYDPLTGTWKTRDKILYGDGMNLYQYVRSSPQGAVDPTGLGGGTTDGQYTPRPTSATHTFAKPGCCCVFTVMVQAANINYKGTGTEFLASMLLGKQGHAWVRLEDRYLPPPEEQRRRPVVLEGGHTGENKATMEQTGEEFGFAVGLLKLQGSYNELDWWWVNWQMRAITVWETTNPENAEDPGWTSSEVYPSNLVDTDNPIRWIQYQYRDGRWHEGHGGHTVTHQASWCLNKDACNRMRKSIDDRRAGNGKEDGGTVAGNDNTLINRFGGFDNGCANTVVRIGNENGIKLDAFVKKQLPPTYGIFRVWTDPKYSWIKINLPDKLKDTWIGATPGPYSHDP